MRKEVLAQTGIDATRWGEDIANPFTNLTADGKAKLKAVGVDADRLSRLKAVLITGKYGGAEAKRFVNRDPDTVLVLGKGFITHEAVYSLGPVLAIEDAHIMGSVTGADLVWFVDKSFPRFAVKGAPLLAGPNTPEPHDREVVRGLLKGDYGWRRPDDFLKLPRLRVGARLPPLAAADADQKKTRLIGEVAGHAGVDTADWCEEVVNPFTNLTAEGQAKLRFRGVDVERLARLKGVLLTGTYFGANSKTFVNRDPDTVLIIGKGFFTHGHVYSLGPILAVEDAHFMGIVTGADLVWFVDKSFPHCSITTGLPVILAPSAQHSQMHPGGEDIWYGDYGWRRPTDFLKPAPVFLTPKDLDKLWTDLPVDEPLKASRVMRKLVAGSEQAIPYLKQRLRWEAAPSVERVTQLVADLNDNEFQKREAATVELEKVKLQVAPRLRKELENTPPPEVRRRLERILGTVEGEQQRLRRALSVFEQSASPEARRLLEELAKGRPDGFLQQEAKAALERLNGKTKP